MDQSAPADASLAAASVLPELLRRTARGDAAAFRALYQAQVRRLNGVALRITRDPSLARDVLHDAFVEVWRNAGQFDPARGSAEVWLLSVVRHRALAVMRRRRRETLGHEPADAPDEAPDALARLLASAEGAALHRCLGELDIQRQRLIVLAYVEGLSHSQLAARLGLPLGTVKSSLRRSLMSVRKCLGR